MSLGLLFFVFLFGLSIGSFLNVVIYRSLHGLSPTKGRSFCDHCKRQLKWFENIPLFSFLALRGQCRTCHKKIPWSYPLVEFTTGLLFLWWASLGVAFFKLTQEPLQVLQPAFWLVIGILLVIVFFTDLLHYIIPDYTVGLLTVLTLAYRFVLVTVGIMRPVDFGLAIISSLVASSLFFLLFLATKGKGIGFGDVKFAIPMGLLLGFPKVIVGFFMSFLVGGIVGIVLLILGKKKFGQMVPFGPFLIVGLIIALVWGNHIWDWYVGLL